MNILVTGGSGVIGNATVQELLRRHTVRLLSRHALEDTGRWPRGVEPFQGDVADAASVRGCASGCDAVLHIAGIAAEEPPERTFENVNERGTRNLVAEALRDGVGRFVFVSSLGAERGTSRYHASKRACEEIVRGSGLRWTIVRPGAVYGPGDDIVTLILRLVRSLPAVPLIDGGSDPFQPLWHEDAGRALAAVFERDLEGETLEIAGDDVTSMRDLLARFAAITGREPYGVPLPSAVARVAASVAGAAGVSLPIDENKLAMLRDHNVLRGENGLARLGIAPTPLDAGLRRLVDALPEQLSEDGVGPLHHKRVQAVIRSRHDAAALMTLVRDRVAEIIPIDWSAEPHTPQRLEPGATLTAALPLRGNIQIRVQAAEPTRILFVTLEGHPLAGCVELTSENVAAGVRFALDVYTRSATTLDRVAMGSIGSVLQDANWRRTVQNVINLSGGTSDGVEASAEELDGDAAEAIEHRVREAVQARQRRDTAQALSEAPVRRGG